MKNFIFALALAGFALAGCASEEAEPTTDVMVEDADVVTEPADDMMMADTTMGADTTGMMMETAPMEDGAMTEDTTATGGM